MKKLKEYLGRDTVITLIFVVFAYAMLAVKNGFMLRWYEEMSLFEPTGLFFRSFLYYPGGMLRYAGAWLTQLMYHPWLGTTVMIALWLLLAWLIRKAFIFSKAMYPLSLIVPLALFVSVAQLDEALLSMKSVGYVYFNTLGYIFTVCGILLYVKISSKAFLRIPLLAALVCCYFVAGFYALLSAFICIMFDVSEGIRERKWLRLAESGIILALMFFLPHWYYLYFQGNTVDNDWLYLKGLPEFFMEKYDVYLWIPFIVASGMLLVLAMSTACGLRLQGKFWQVCSVAALAVCGIWAFKAEKKSEQLRATVLMLQSMERGDWKRMQEIIWRAKESPDYTMMVLCNIASERLGENPRDLSGIRPVNIDPRHSETFTATAFLNIPANYYMGKVNQSYRWAMEHSVQYGRKVFFLKYMVKAALVRGETELARRYNDILHSTMFHREWAGKMDRYIDDPSQIGENPEFEYVIAAREALDPRHKN